MRTLSHRKLGLLTLVVAVVVGVISVVSVTASDNDSEKQRAIDNAQRIVNPPTDPPRLAELSDFGESGNPADVAAVKAAAPHLIQRYNLTLALPDTPTERADELNDSAKRAKREAGVREVFARSAADEKVKLVEDSIRAVYEYDHYEGFTDYRVTVDHWYGVTVDGDTAFVGFHGFEDYFTPSGWKEEGRGQWHVRLERDGGVWKLLSIKTRLDQAP